MYKYSAAFFSFIFHFFYLFISTCSTPRTSLCQRHPRTSGIAGCYFFLLSARVFFCSTSRSCARIFVANCRPIAQTDNRMNRNNFHRLLRVAQRKTQVKERLKSVYIDRARNEFALCARSATTLSRVAYTCNVAYNVRLSFLRIRRKENSFTISSYIDIFMHTLLFL